MLLIAAWAALCLSLVLSPTTAQAQPAPDVARAGYAAGLAARDAGDYAGAAQRFAGAAREGGPLAPMARLRQAQMLVAARQRDAAAPVFAAVLAEDALPVSLAQIALTETATNLDALNRRAEAVAVLRRLDRLDGLGANARASARWEVAAIRKTAGEAGWVDEARAAIELSTAFGGATAALDALEAAGVTLPPLTAALVDYRAFRNAAAGQRLIRAIIDPSRPLSTADAATAWFYLGALQERASQPDAALTAYTLSAALNPGGPLADDSTYWRGAILGDRGDLPGQIAEFDRLARSYPDSPFAARARLAPAVELGRAGRTSEALTRLEAIAAGPRPDEAATAARWHQLFRAAPGVGPRVSLSPATYDPTSFGAVLERTAVDPQRPLPAAAAAERPTAVAMTADDAITISQWMRATFGPQPQTLVADADDPLRRLGFALVAAGDGAVGRTLLGAAIAARVHRPYDLLEVALHAAAARVYDIEVAAARKLLEPLDGAAQLAAPRAVLRLAFPAPFLEETLSAAQQANVPPLLLLALVRQESAFYPDAGSSADAYGLAQFIPSTAVEVMRDLGITLPLEQALRDPATSLRMGARYLAVQTKVFDGDSVAALAAYNAGGSNARRWLAAQTPKNTDGYRWGVDFSETRAYLERVLVNYAWYRYIYAGAPLAVR